MGKNGNPAGLVMLEEQNRRFALHPQHPIRGSVQMKKAVQMIRLQIRVENLLPKQNERTYKAMILGRNKGASVYAILGDVHIDAEGRGIARFEIQENDADQKGNPFHCFSIFMIASVPSANSRQPLQPVLKGDWQYKENRNFNAFYADYLKESTQQLISKELQFTETIPFQDQKKWRRVTSPIDFPIASLDAREAIKQFGHFIVSYNEELCFLGIPGKGEVQPDHGKSGFLQWEPIRGSEEYGYWLVGIQRNTGIITEFP